ncbi:MAG: cyclohexanecarboxylate-CoA ligase [Alphaproteobacteria bacterium]
MDTEDLAPGTTLQLDDVIAFLDQQDMAKQYFPETLAVMNSLPRTPSGKIQKFLLRQKFTTS